MAPSHNPLGEVRKRRAVALATTRGDHSPARTRTVTQAEFAELIGVSQPRVSALVKAGVLRVGDSAHGWIRSYVAHLTDSIEARSAAGFGELALERAALASAQREAQEQRNAATARAFAPRALMADVLAAVCEYAAQRTDEMQAAVDAACPGLPTDARAVVAAAITAARDAWRNGGGIGAR